jgi:hypothetical protein
LEEFPKAVIGYINWFLKPQQTVLKNLGKLASAAAFGNLFMWPQAAFEQPFMTALPAS